MTNYVWRTKDKSGKSVVREVTANTIEESKALLASEGCTDLELFQDEIMAAATEGMDENVTVMGKEINVTAEQRLEQVNKPPLTICSAIRQGVGESKGLTLFMVGLCAFLAYRGYVISALIAGCAILAWVGFMIGVAFPSVNYAKLAKAADWARWKEVLDLVERLERSNKINFIKVPAPELGRFRATALAGLGKVDEAVAGYAQFENQRGCPSWLHKAFLIGIYNVANRHDKALECTRKSLEENPTPVLQLEMANQLARYHNDAAGARAALSEGEKATVPETLKPNIKRTHGIIAYLERDYASAKTELETSIKMMEATPHVPGRDGNIRVARGYLCCVLANLGSFDEARKQYEQAKEYLVATKENDLLAECEKALSNSV
jgi:tetratricopeptide (TPR) repeat protein